MDSHVASDPATGSDIKVQCYDLVVSQLAQQDKVPWYRKPNLRMLYLIMLPSCLGVQVTGGFDASMMNGLQTVSSWRSFFHHPHSASLGLMSAIYSVGGVVGAPFVPYFTDKFGRRCSILLGSILMMIGGALQCAAHSFAMFVIARFMLGLGIVFAIVAASALVAELSHPKERAIMGSLFNSSYFIGSLIAAGVTFGTFAMHNNWGWRIPSLLQIIPSLFQIIFTLFLPESPRWLISKGRGDEAYAILVKYHAEGDENSTFVKAEFSEIEQTLAEELADAHMSWREVLSTAGMRKRAMIATFLGLSIKLSGNGLILYYLSPILSTIGIHNSRTKNIVNVAKGGWDLVTGTFLALTVSRYPRRTVYLTCTISLLVIFVAWTAASAEYALTRSQAASHVVLVLIFLYSPAHSMGFNALIYTYLVELFPFHTRARGITILQSWSRAAGILTLFVDPIGIENAGWKYNLVFCAWNAFQVVFVYFMLPETSGRTLEELTFLYEEDRGRVPKNA